MRLGLLTVTILGTVAALGIVLADILVQAEAAEHMQRGLSLQVSRIQFTLWDDFDRGLSLGNMPLSRALEPITRNGCVGGVQVFDGRGNVLFTSGSLPPIAGQTAPDEWLAIIRNGGNKPRQSSRATVLLLRPLFNAFDLPDGGVALQCSLPDLTPTGPATAGLLAFCLSAWAAVILYGRLTHGRWRKNVFEDTSPAPFRIGRTAQVSPFVQTDEKAIP